MLGPIDIAHLQLHDLGDPEPAAQHEQKEGAVHGDMDVCKQLFNLLLRECFRERSAASQDMTGFDGVHVEDLVFDEKIKHMFQCIQPSIDGGRR